MGDAGSTRWTRLSAAAAGVVATHGIAVLVGWAAGWPLFVSPPPQFIPMAPSTALAFIVLGLAFGLHVAGPTRGAVRVASLGAAWVIALLALLNLVVPARLDAVLGGATGLFGRVQLGVMSPVTAASLLPLAAAIARRDTRRHVAGACATLAAAVGATVVLGYAYGTPLLYGTATIPVALPTGLSFLVLGAATVAACGPDAWLLRSLSGPSPRARMLRAFLPATAGLVVLIGLLDTRFGDAIGVDSVLVSAWLAVGGVALMTLLVTGQARRIGAELDDAYAERHRAEQRYRGIFEQTPAGVATTTRDGLVLLCNRAFADMFGFETPEALIGLPTTELYWEPADRERLMDALRETGQLRNVEIRLRRRDGKSVWVLAHLTLHDADTAAARVEHALIDVSERKALEQQLWQAQKLDALGSLAGGVAHDFNNLLTAIMGYAELLHQDLPDDDPSVSDVEEIEKACARAAGLTRQLLAFSRRQPFEPKALRLNETVRAMENMLRRLLTPEVELVTASDDVVASVWADPSQVEQVVLNLAVNARDAMPDGGTVTVETRNMHVDAGDTIGQGELPAGTYVLLSVSDTGSGMDRHTLAHIFEPFFTTKPKGKGTGLGLATTYGIVKQTRGHILVYSERGVGTTFKCFFPVTDAPVEAGVVPTASVGVGGRETVLVVEDEPAILALVVAGLERHGYQVLAAPDGQSAIRLADAHDGVIQLVLSDGVLADVRVPELLRRLRERRPESRILLMSGYSQEAVFQYEVVEASTAFLPKPFTVRQLAARVREVLDGPPPGAS